MSPKTPLLDAPPYLRKDRDSFSSSPPSSILATFILMSVCFAANHGAVTSCLGLSSARLGNLTYLNADLGTWQSGTLYITYTLSAVFGAAHIVKILGPRNGLFAGLVIYCVYVSCFLVAALVEDTLKWPVAIAGAFIGGIGGGFLWTAQGAYFVKVSEAYARSAGIEKTAATSYLGGIFAFFYLFEEVAMKLLSTLLTETLNQTWLTVFAIYTAIAVLSAIGILFCHKFPIESTNDGKDLCYKLTSAVRIWSVDPKMKYMVPLNAVFGFAAAFLGAYVTGQVVHFTGRDNYAGALTAIPAGVAALMSLVLGKVGQVTGKGPILIGGALSFAAMSAIFVARPAVDGWGWGALVTVYALMGIGRSTFESTLRATFADFFSKDTEGAFANIILQSGLASSVAFFVFPHLQCSTPSDYCIEYKNNGGLHNVLALELVVIATAALAIIGYLRAAALRRKEVAEEEIKSLVGNEIGETV